MLADRGPAEAGSLSLTCFQVRCDFQPTLVDQVREARDLARFFSAFALL